MSEMLSAWRGVLEVDARGRETHLVLVDPAHRLLEAEAWRRCSARSWPRGAAPSLWICSQTRFASAFVSPTLSAWAGVAKPTPMPTAQSGEDRDVAANSAGPVEGPHVAARGEHRVDPSNSPAGRQRPTASAGPRQPRRSTHSPTHSGQPVTPSAAAGCTATELFASVCESARWSVVQAPSERAAQVAVRTGSSPRDGGEPRLRGGCAAALRRRGARRPPAACRRRRRARARSRSCPRRARSRRRSRAGRRASRRCRARDRSHRAGRASGGRRHRSRGAAADGPARPPRARQPARRGRARRDRRLPR